MAAGILDDQGKLVAGLSISAPADRLEEAWLDRLRSTAAQISAASATALRRRHGGRVDAAGAQIFGLARQCAGRPCDPVTQRRTRSASPMREYLPAESRNTMISWRPAILACITRQRPASEM